MVVVILAHPMMDLSFSRNDLLGHVKSPCIEAAVKTLVAFKQSVTMTMENCRNDETKCWGFMVFLVFVASQFFRKLTRATKFGFQHLFRFLLTWWVNRFLIPFSFSLNGFLNYFTVIIFNKLWQIWRKSEIMRSIILFSSSLRFIFVIRRCIRFVNSCHTTSTRAN